MGLKNTDWRKSKRIKKKILILPKERKHIQKIEAKFKLIPKGIKVMKTEKYFPL